MAYKGDLGNGRLNRHISYFRECYEADNRELGLWNVFRDKHWHLYFLDGQEELVTGAMPRVPIDASLAEKASKSQSLYQRERTLLYASYFVVGNVREAGRARSICAPLLHYQAMLQQEREDWYLSIDPADENLNVPLARWLRDRSKQEDNDTMLEPDLGGTTLGKAGPAKIAPWLRALLPDIDCLELFKFPRLCSADTLKKMLESMPAGRLAVYPASALVLVAKSPNTRGILHELSQISAADVSPTALGQILGADSRANKRRSRSDPDEVPGLLNEAQKKALISAADSRVGLVVGPPGTGKSYTIAAMAIDRMAHGEPSSLFRTQNKRSMLSGRRLTRILVFQTALFGQVAVIISESSNSMSMTSCMVSPTRALIKSKWNGFQRQPNYCIAICESSRRS